MLKQKLAHRQKPVFAQSLRQSVKMLELPLLDLKNIIEAEMMANPVIEEAPQDSQQDLPEFPVAVSADAHEESDSALFDEGAALNNYARYEKPLPGAKENLGDFLLRQLRIAAADERETRIGACIIQQIDENGYFQGDLSGVCADADCEPEEALGILVGVIQNFEPAGVAARTLKECLLIQLKKRGENNALLFKIISRHLDDLSQDCCLAKLCKKLKCSEEEARRSLERIRSLEPKPGRLFSDEETAYVIPDITIEEKDSNLVVSTKDDVLPVVRINPVYRNMLKSTKINDDVKEFIRQRLVLANDLIRALRNRKETFLKVVGFIAEVQKDAILEGSEKLKPLTLKEIAEKVHMHESTISRVVMHKYVQAPSGIWRLRDFFSGSLKTTEGGDISSWRVKVKIKELIDSEDKACPLRDQKIAELINETEKTPIARRTVAKYRGMLKIPPVSRRRRMAG